MKEDSEIIVYTILYTTGQQPIGLQVILGALTLQEESYKNHSINCEYWMQVKPSGGTDFGFAGKQKRALYTHWLRPIAVILIVLASFKTLKLATSKLCMRASLFWDHKLRIDLLAHARFRNFNGGFYLVVFKF